MDEAVETTMNEEVEITVDEALAIIRATRATKRLAVALRPLGEPECNWHGSLPSTPSGNVQYNPSRNSQLSPGKNMTAAFKSNKRKALRQYLLFNKVKVTILKDSDLPVYDNLIIRVTTLIQHFCKTEYEKDLVTPERVHNPRKCLAALGFWYNEDIAQVLIAEGCRLLSLSEPVNDLQRKNIALRANRMVDIVHPLVPNPTSGGGMRKPETDTCWETLKAQYNEPEPVQPPPAPRRPILKLDFPDFLKMSVEKQEEWVARSCGTWPPPPSPPPPAPLTPEEFEMKTVFLEGKKAERVTSVREFIEEMDEQVRAAKNEVKELAERAKREELTQEKKPVMEKGESSSALAAFLQGPTSQRAIRAKSPKL